MHTIVCVLAGRARRVLQRGGAPRAVVQRRAAAAVPVPRGGEVPQLHVAEGTINSTHNVLYCIWNGIHKPSHVKLSQYVKVYEHRSKF